MTPQHVRIIYYYAFHIFLVLCMVHPLLSVKFEREKSIDCEEGAVKEDLKDCASYFQCLDGKIVKQQCHNGSYFDPAWEVCVIDPDGICKSANCTEGVIEENPEDPCGYLKCINGSFADVECTSESYFNSTLKTCLIDEDGVCSAIPETCIEGDIEEASEDPCGYLKCENGSLVEVNCTSGSYFNSTLKICLIDEDGVCSAIPETCIEGEIEEAPEDPCGYLKCENGSLVEVNCTRGSYFNSTLKICLIDEDGVCSAIPETCIEGEIQEAPEDPCGYLKCENGSLVEVNCTSGSYFNSTLKICLIDEDGVCSAIPETCIEGEIEEAPEDPCGYLKCENGSLVEVNCTSGSYFNSTLKICLIDEDGVCSAIPETCIEGEIEEAPEDPCGYLKCENGSLVEVNCTSGSYFNSTLKICLIDEDGVCSAISETCIEGEIEEAPEDPCGYLKCENGSLVEVNCTSGSYFNSTLKICLIDEDGVCSAIPETCIEGEIEEAPEDPCGYLKCENGSLVEVNCTSGSYFNSTLKICLIDEDGVCSAIPETCIEGEIEEAPEDPCGYLKCENGSLVEVNCNSGSYFNSTLKICLIDEDGVCSAIPETCIEGEIEEAPEDPCGYLKCENGSLVEVNCTSGSYFNSTLKICLIDEDGVCSAIPETCIEGEIEEAPEDPCGYLKCENGSLVEVNCTSGSYFNSTLKICLIDEDGVCSAISDNYIEGEIKEDPENPCGYLNCVNGGLVKVNCSSGSYFDSTLKICVTDVDGVCSSISGECIDGEIKENPEDCCGYLICKYGTFSEENCTSGEYYNSTLQTCLIDESGVCSPISEGCVEGELAEDPEECGGYLQCIHGEMVNQLCSYGRYFHSELKSCVVDNNGVCTPITENCEEGDRETDPEDCTSYLECIDGDFVAQKCTEGSYFELNIKACVIDENGVCIPLVN